jgi:hypothetical protein
VLLLLPVTTITTEPQTAPKTPTPAEKTPTNPAGWAPLTHLIHPILKPHHIKPGLVVLARGLLVGHHPPHLPPDAPETLLHVH